MRVFISYRRSDSKDIAARVADNLAQVREIDSVFLDVDSIAHGEHFPGRLDTEVRRADVVLAVIGQGWMGAKSDNGVPRIQSDNDFVRREIATALRADKRVIPCLVDDASMPGPADLPYDIAGLAERNACSLRHTTYRVDFEIVCEAILGKRRVGEMTPMALGLGALWRSALGVLAAALVAIAIASLGVSALGKPLETILGGRVVLVVFLIVIFALFQWETVRFVRRFG